MTINWTMIDSQGMPIDLTGCGFSSASSVAAGPQFVFRIRENLSLGFSQESPVEFEVYLVNAENGEIQIVLPETATGLPGVYYAEVATMDDNGLIVYTNLFYVVIERGLFGVSNWTGGPPLVAELKLHLRDSAPEESLLLDNIRFDDAEIALATSRPVEYWNEIPPPLGKRMTTQNFPFRFHWMDGIVANLFWMLEEQYRANNLTYSAAGVQVNDQDKEPNYARAAERRWANYVEFVKRKKASINMENAFGGIGSSYSYSSRGSGTSGYTY
jgi:hypothetical protein